MQDTKRFVGENGEFVSTYKLEKGTICIGYLEELLEWVYYHDVLTKEEKLQRILPIENIIQEMLNGGGGGRPVSSMAINYVPTWSKKSQDAK